MSTSISDEEIFASRIGHRVERNPRTGNLRIKEGGNDVMYAIDLLGGVAAAAENLGVPEIEIENWIDAHYVPTRYARTIRLLKGFLLSSIQEPPYWIEIGDQFWPESGRTAAERDYESLKRSKKRKA